MIKLLRINNIALIASLEVELGPGLTLLTGETGAGKSILIDALGLVLGERSSADLIRTGEERGVVEALVEGSALRAFLEEHGLPTEGDEVVVRREIYTSGKGRATVNGALVPVGLLKELAPLLAAVHGQHDPQGLLDPAWHLDLLDHHAGIDRELVQALYLRLREVEGELDRLRKDRREGERRREMLAYQAEEIEKAHLRPGEEEALRTEKAVQANAGRLAGLSSEAYGLLYEEDGAALSRLGQVFRKVEELGTIDPAFAPFLEGRGAALAQLEDLALFLRDYRERIQVAPGRLDEVESRLASIDRLKKKYGATTLEGVLAYGAQCRRELEEAGTPEEQERALETERATLVKTYFERARELSRERRAASLDLQKKVRAELGQLAMEKARFEVVFRPEVVPASAGDTSGWTEKGLETAEFLLSPNPGEDLRPLARIASGGELSRILLGLKSVASLDARGLTLVFDEVDAGIGGRVAEVVGKKLRSMAARHQVVCVTHLPQIASLADRHYAVRKRVERGRTTTEVASLGPEERVEEIARMLGGEKLTETARHHAREMVNQNLRS